MSKRSIDVAIIPGSSVNKSLRVSVDYDRRRDGQGIYIKFLPVERTTMGSVQFCITALVSMPTIHLESAKRFNRRRLEIAAENLVFAINQDDSCYAQSVISTLVSAYETICNHEDYREWGFPDWKLAKNEFCVKREAMFS